jgi:regulator of replication initiation timing
VILSKKLLAAVSLSACIMLPAPGFSDVRIVLKNGRSIAAESCEDRDGQLTCFRAGGSFSIEKDEIAEIKGLASGKSAPAGESFIERPSEEIPPGEALSGGKDGVQKSERPELEKKLGEIHQKKKDLGEERAKLLKERDQLKADLDKAPDWMPENQFTALSRRVADLDKKIQTFNKEASRLDIEEKKIIDQLEDGSQKQEKETGRN